MKRGSYKKLASSKFTYPCWYCKKNTHGILNLPYGSEVWACPNCAAKHGKIRRLRHLNTKIEKQTILDQIYTGKNKEMWVLQ